MTLTNATQTPANPTGPPSSGVPNGILRDQWDRPLVVRPDGTVGAYTRASSLGGTLEDQHGIGEWKMKLVAWAVAHSRALQLEGRAIETTDAHPDKQALGKLVKRALDVADSDAAARIGTAYHAMTERIDAGQPVPDVGDEDRYALEAYAELMADFTVHSMETFTVCPELETAGTFDRLLSPKGVMTAPDGTTITPDDRLIDDLKGLALDTPIPTPDGWTTMGAIQAGDVVFGSDGRPCAVTAKSETKRIGTYIVEFTGGERIVCDREHLWWVMTGRTINGAGKPSNRAREQVIDVETMRDTLFRYGQRQHRVPVAAPLDLPAAELPIDPYLFGCWLGDGGINGGTITKEPALFELLAADGHHVGPAQRNHSDKVVTCTIGGLSTALRVAGVRGHRTIPDKYLRGSIEQRTALLRGLMDTDGTWNIARERAVFSSTDKGLAEQVAELCLSLGLRPQRNSWTASGFGVTTTAYGVEFRPIGFNPFRLARKAERVTWHTTDVKSRYRMVQSVEPGPDVETACIAVDSPNRTYLCGRDMIPTHNTSSSARYFGLKFAVQLVPYAYGRPYRGWEDMAVRAQQERDGVDLDSLRAKVERTRGEYLEWPDGIAPRTDWALIMHVPSGGSSAMPYWVDLRAGMEAARLACTVREWRKRKGLVVSAERPSVPMDQALNGAGLRSLIEHAADRQACKALWVQHKSMWSAEHTALVTARFPA